MTLLDASLKLNAGRIILALQPSVLLVTAGDADIVAVIALP